MMLMLHGQYRPTGGFDYVVDLIRTVVVARRGMSALVYCRRHFHCRYYRVTPHNSHYPSLCLEPVALHWRKRWKARYASHLRDHCRR